MPTGPAASVRCEIAISTQIVPPSLTGTRSWQRFAVPESVRDEKVGRDHGRDGPERPRWSAPHRGRAAEPSRRISKLAARVCSGSRNRALRAPPRPLPGGRRGRNFSGRRIESLWCQDCQGGSGTSKSVSFIEIFAREDHFSASAHSLPRGRPPQSRRSFSPSSARMKLIGGSVGASRYDAEPCP